MVLLEARNIYKTFTNKSADHPVIQGVSLALEKGESLAITGSSGNGKTTLLNILGTLDTPTSGDVLFFGEKLSPHEYPSLRNRHLGFIFQHFHLLESESVETNIMIPAIIAGNSLRKKTVLLDRAAFLAERVGLKHKFHTKAALLSGGEKQRVAIARALINNPEIILADEPSGNLDDNTSTSIHDLLLSLTSEGKGLIIVTHNPRLVGMCSRHCVLKNGQFS